MSMLPPFPSSDVWRALRYRRLGDAALGIDGADRNGSLDGFDLQRSGLEIGLTLPRSLSVAASYGDAIAVDIQSRCCDGTSDRDVAAHRNCAIQGIEKRGINSGGTFSDFEDFSDKGGLVSPIGFLWQ